MLSQTCVGVRVVVWVFIVVGDPDAANTPSTMKQSDAPKRIRSRFIVGSFEIIE
jgi:hypothetical protein